MAKLFSNAGRLKAVFPILLLFGPALFLVFISTRGCKHKFKQLDDYGAIPNYSFKGIDGKIYTNSSFKDKIVIYTTIQPSCPDSCGVALWHLDQLLYQQLRKNKKKLGHVKIVSFVTDGKGNPSNRLNEVAFTLNDQCEGYDPNIWILAEGNGREVFNMKHNGQTLLQKGNKYLGGEGFQELMLLSDKKNHLRMVLQGNIESMIRTMRDHIALLEKQYDIEAYQKKHPTKQ